MEEVNKRAYEDTTKISQYLNRGLICCEREIFSKYLCKDDIVLDVGCFVGRVSFSISNIVKQVVGIDVSEIGIETALKQKEKSSTQNCHFLIASAQEIPFDDDYFDKVLMPYNVIEDINPVEMRNRALSEIHKKLKGKGLLIFSIHNRFYIRWYFYLVVINLVRLVSKIDYPLILNFISHYKNKEGVKILLNGEPYSIPWREPNSSDYLVHYFYSLSKIKRQLSNIGFRIVDIIPIEDQSPHTMEGRLAKVIHKKLPYFLIPEYYVVASKVNLRN